MKNVVDTMSSLFWCTGTKYQTAYRQVQRIYRSISFSWYGMMPSLMTLAMPMKLLWHEILKGWALPFLMEKITLHVVIPFLLPKYNTGILAVEFIDLTLTSYHVWYYMYGRLKYLNFWQNPLWLMNTAFVYLKISWTKHNGIVFYKCEIIIRCCAKKSQSCVLSFYINNERRWPFWGPVSLWLLWYVAY